MHIKQIIIQGFKSYKEQTVIEPFSPGTNVIVGRNGSGKSNFFAAIRFVLSDAYTNMGREERQALLHEGSGSAVMSAYVEIVFDNTDKRFSEPGDEVIIRRTIGLKKDEYSVDKKVQTRSDVLKILETAGFAKENPFYIVPQGRIAAITNMKESERLNLLKEIAGTNTYDDRRIQSLKIMAETNSKREKIDELLDYIKERLSELEEEKNELRDFQDKDRERKCLEYARWHRLQENNAAQLEQIEDARQGGAGVSSRDQAQLQKTEKEIADLERKLQDVAKSLELLELERQQLDEDKKATARSRAKAELNVKDLDATRHAREQQQRQQEEELASLTQRIQEAERELAKIIPNYEKCKAQEAKAKSQRQVADAGYNRLLSKQTQTSRFKTKADRDAHLDKQIKEITTQIGGVRANEMESKEQYESLDKSIAELEKSLENMRKQNSNYSGERTAMLEKLKEAGRVKEDHEEERKRLRREEDKLRALINGTRKDRDDAEKELRKHMDNSTSQGLASIKRLRRERDIPGAYGTLAELMEVPADGYRLPVEQVAGNSLFHYVVDNEKTATMLSDHLFKTRGGRLTFMPLEQLRPRRVQMPRASDAVPLISRIEYDPTFEKAFQQVFGRTIVCPNLMVASQYARTHGLDAITPEGDTTNKRGAMTGGYVDLKRSRLLAVRKVNELRDRFEEQMEDLDKIVQEIDDIGQKVTAAAGEVTKLDQEIRRHFSTFESVRNSLQTTAAQLQRETDRREKTRQRLAEAEENLRQLDSELQAATDERQTEFKKSLSASEERELEEFTKQKHILNKACKDISAKRLELEGEKKRLETLLNTQLKPQQDQLQSQAFESISGGGSLSFQEAQAELKKAQKAYEKVKKLADENEGKRRDAATSQAQLETQKAQKEEELQELLRRIDQYQKKMERNIQLRARLTNQQAEYAKNIREIGSLPEGFAKYEKMATDKIETRLRKVNEVLKKYKHINKKAFDQYTSFTTQRDHLLKRRKELDTSQESIEELIEHLDQAKDEAIERTFKQVSKEFATIFEQLVPAGHGRLVIQRKADRGKNRQVDSDEEQATSVENYTGVGISVSFNSKVLDEQQKIQQLSGGQKSLCALCLIFALQAAESSPFVIFDEVDANLDAQYRTAVAALLDSISKIQKTQFICTTFRPEIVLVADKCYGVTFHNKTSTIDCVPTEEALNFVEGQRK
ncbi:RecF/RecN/SMC [Cercophora newfieldiana]|uniref:Structural maintenance of chromosomes protein n=1 Tax=Cercophora newfieldiana TaxID=92897 RepID=A0AA39Y571_9PEZI|nr:RecF/RecN/SMC [Cercophora newfieldiana]